MRSIRFRLLITLALVTSLALGTVALFASRTTTNEFQRYVARDENLYDEYVEPLIVRDISGYIRRDALDCGDVTGSEVGNDNCASAGFGSDEASLREAKLFVTDMARSTRTRIVMLNSSGEVLIDSDAPLGVVQNTATLHDPAGVIIVQGTPIIIYVERIDSRATGSEAQDFVRTVNRSLLFAVVVAGAAVALLTAVSSQRILGPVEALTAAARRMAKGDLSQRVQVDTNDELAELADAFNAMADGLAEMETLRRNMVSDVAHELRTPLANIRGYLEALRDGLVSPTPEVTELLHDEALLLSRLVEDLQELALAEAGQLKLVRQPVALAEVSHHVIQALQPSIQRKQITVTSNVPADLPQVDADPERVGQVLRNLLTNAITHTPGGGLITLSASASASDITVTVSDSGAGIAPDELSFIFERFYRADKSRARTTGGVGLGLAIVKQLVQAHGGDIAVHSSPNHGTTFQFTLPLAFPV